MRAVLFTDLNCPFCYATEFRIVALGLSAAVDWRGVEHEPDLPVPMDRRDEEVAAEVAEEVASVRARAPEVPITVPPGKANTAAGLVAVAAVLRTEPSRARAFREALYAAFWRDGRDIADRALIDDVARGNGIDTLEPRREDELRVATWRLDWEKSPLQGVPLLVREDGETVYGLTESAVLEGFLTQAPGRAGD